MSIYPVVNSELKYTLCRNMRMIIDRQLIYRCYFEHGKTVANRSIITMRDD